MKHLLCYLWLAAIAASAQAGRDSGSPQPAILGWQSSWQREVQESDALAERGRLVEAEAILRDLVGRMERAGARGYPMASALHYLGALYVMQGRFPEAETSLRRALGESRADSGAGREESPGRAWILLTCGQLYSQVGRIRDAQRLLLEALDIQRQFHRPDNRLRVLLTGNLGETYWREGRYADAEAKLREALSVAESGLSPQDPAGATVLNNLALVLDATGRTKDAIPLAERGIRIWERGARTRHPDFAVGLANLAEFLTRCGRYEEAERLFVQALSIQRDVFREQHPTMGYMLRDYAVLLRITGRRSESKQLAKRSQAILRHAETQNQQGLVIDVKALRNHR